MVTGKDPGELGCYGFRNRKDRSYAALTLADSSAVESPSLWTILSRHGRRSIVVGVPQTYPARPLKGIMVAGFPAPEEGAFLTYPPDFRHELDRISGGYVLDVKGFRTDRKDDLLSQIRDMTRRRFCAVRHLMAGEWDFMMAVEMGPDRIHHGFWKCFDPEHPRYVAGSAHEGAVEDYYRLLDAELESVLGLLTPQDSLMVVSDHGARPMAGGVYINEWLRERGHLQLLHEPSEPIPFDPSLVDWDRTTAWAEGGYYARIFLNVRDREPKGVLPRADYERFREMLAREIEEMVDPQGRPLGNRALRPEGLYRQCRGVPPDLMVYLGELGWRALAGMGAGGIYSAENDTGPDDANHDPWGIFMLLDPWRSGSPGEIPPVDVLDVAPTVLDRMSVPIPADMAGRVIGETRREESRA
jgi:predicted AlkP superfamily phosphohydrolase/phosphomutase